MTETDTSEEQVRELLAQLAAEREAFRREVAQHSTSADKLGRRKKQIHRLHTAARAEKLRIRALYKRFLRHMKRKWAGERIRVENERAVLSRERADLERTANESLEYQNRLYTSWEHLQEAQRRLLVDRQQAEQWIAQQSDSLEHRAQTVAQHERQFAANRDHLESKSQALQSEIAGLEARAANARAAVEQLELRQSRLLVPADGFSDSMSISLLPFDRPVSATASSDAEGLLVDLHSRQQDLDRVRRKIFAARDELARQTTSLDDQRAILSEQVATLVAARELWNAAELATLDDMETLVRSLRAKEHAIEERERRSLDAERLNGERAGELWQLRERLEAWRKALADNETAYLAARDQHAAALEEQQKRLEWREGCLEETAVAWGEIREREREHYLGILQHLESERAETAAVLANAERDRRECAAEIARVASLQLALEESAGDKEKVQSLAANWEKQFEGWEKQIEAAQVRSRRSAADMHHMRLGLERAVNRWFDERSVEIDAKRVRGRFASEAEEPDQDIPAIPSEQLARDAEMLREEVGRLSAKLGLKKSVEEPLALTG